MSSPWSSPGRTPQPFNFNGFGGIKGVPPHLILGGVLVIGALVILFSTYFTIDQGERGVILHWGAVVGEAEPGLHFKLPVITTVEKISGQTQKEGLKKPGNSNPRLQAYSRDQQPATIAMAVNYHVT